MHFFFLLFQTTDCLMTITGVIQHICYLSIAISIYRVSGIAVLLQLQVQEVQYMVSKHIKTILMFGPSNTGKDGTMLRWVVFFFLGDGEVAEGCFVCLCVCSWWWLFIRILFYSRLCPSTAGSSPPPESSIFLSFFIRILWCICQISS